jgi:hypothetical protein
VKFVHIVFLLNALAAPSFAGFVSKDLYMVADLSRLEAELTKATQIKPDRSQITTVKIQEENGVDATHLRLLMNTFPNLNAFSFWGVNGLDMSDLKPAELNRIQEVNIYCGTFTTENLKSVVMSENLRILSITWNLGVENVEGLKPLKESKSLESLYLHGDYTADLFAILIEVPKLKEVDVDTKEKIDSLEVDDFYRAYAARYNTELRLKVETAGKVYERNPDVDL